MALDGFRRVLADITRMSLQPDITKTAGISEGREICRLVIECGQARLSAHVWRADRPLRQRAPERGDRLVCHGWRWIRMPNPLFELLLNDAPTVADGQLQLPAGVGLGDDLLRPGAFEAAEVR